MNRESINLIYLSYVPFGTSYLIDFLDSYQRNEAGVEHKLIILFNGFKHLDDIDKFISILNSSSLNYEHLLSPEKFDIISYFFAARTLTSDSIAFVNTYSIILQDNWLRYLYENLLKEGIGVVGATAGWGDFGHDDEYRTNLQLVREGKFNINIIKKIIFYRFNFFPNVKAHIRTNAFMIKREFFLSMEYVKVKPFFLNFFIDFSKSKLRSLCFEHGNHGFTTQIQNKGLKALVVDKFGKGHEVGDWNKTKTFWTSNQENLLVSDNQTRKYQGADSGTRKKLTYAAWGI